MRLSELQKYILKECYRKLGERVDRTPLIRFYQGDSRAKVELRTKIITQSIESLIDRELLFGFGMRTPHKWYIREIILTTKGKKIAKLLTDRQLRLPLK